MGSIKEKWMDEQQDRQHHINLKKLADYFDLTIEQVEQYEPEIDDVMTNDDMAVAHSVTFPEHTPKEILEKIGGAYHQVELHFFEGDDGNFDEEISFEEGRENDGSVFLDGPPIPPDQAKKLGKDDK